MYLKAIEMLFVILSSLFLYTWVNILLNGFTAWQ